MIRPLPRIVRFAASLRDSTSGLALTEFAVSLPVLLTLGLVGLETANFAMAHLRVSNIAMMTADNAARVRDSIDESDVVELFTGAKMTGSSIDFATRGRIILSSLENNGTNQWIRWQRCDGTLNVAPLDDRRPRTAGGVAITNGTEIFNSDRTTAATAPSSAAMSGVPATGMGPTGQQISAATATAVMVVEVTYDYKPLVIGSFLDNRRITYSSAFNVRQRTDQSIKNAAHITPRRCDQFNA